MAIITGGPGRNTLTGTSNDDTIRGLGGDDSLWGADGHDVVLGGAGDDIVSDSRGGDTLAGGAGVDVFSGFYGTFFGGGVGAINFTLAPGAEFITPWGSTARGFERLDITGSDYNDTITGGALDDVVRGWDGNDRLDGSGRSDYLIGDNGDDTLQGGNSEDLVTGNGGSDVLYGGRGDDTLIGGSNSDVQAGNDTVSGGSGADKIRIGPNITTILYDTSRQGVYVDLIRNVGYGGEAQGDTFDRGSIFARVSLVGSAHDDLLVGGEWIDGGAGDDLLSANWATLEMNGGEGLDRFIITFDPDFIYERTLIEDFDQASGEKIDLTTIDAGPNGRSFTFIGTDAFSGAPGEVRYYLTGDGRTAIEMNVNRDTTADHTFFLQGEYTLTTDDFLV